MMPAMALELRTITDDEVPGFREALMTVFGGDAEDDEGGADRFRALVDPSQAWAAVDGGHIVATAATFNLAIGIPGGTLPIAGLTMVTVRPTHRRRGLLRELIRVHLDDARGRGLAVSGLWASEASIYGRFGYGVAAHHDELAVDAAQTMTVAGNRELDRIEWIDEAGARAELPAIYAAATSDRPGALRRTEPWWRERRFLEAPFMRHGASRRRHVIARRGAEAVGYLGYRQRGEFEQGLPTGKTEINELIALDPRAEATLWRFALGMDLFPSVSWWCAPTDSTLPWIVDNPRRVRRSRVDNLWLRIDDVGAALAARRYAGDGTVRFALDDTTSWELVVEAGVGRCAPTARAPELQLARTTLGALYLGSTAATELARADLVHGDAAAIATADRLFGWPVAAWCPEIF